MSGTNKLVQSENAMNNGSQSALTKCLEDANNEALRINKTPVRKEDKKKK